VTRGFPALLRADKMSGEVLRSRQLYLRGGLGGDHIEAYVVRDWKRVWRSWGRVWSEESSPPKSVSKSPGGTASGVALAELTNRIMRACKKIAPFSWE
jgi:hypothetical protein